MIVIGAVGFVLYRIAVAMQEKLEWLAAIVGLASIGAWIIVALLLAFSTIAAATYVLKPIFGHHYEDPGYEPDNWRR